VVKPPPKSGKKKGKMKSTWVDLKRQESELDLNRSNATDCDMVTLVVPPGFVKQQASSKTYLYST